MHGTLATRSGIGLSVSVAVMPTKHERAQTTAATLSRGPVLAVSLALVVVLTVLFKVWGSLVTDDSLGIIRSQLAFTSSRFSDVIGTWNIAEFIRLTATLDFVYPIAYGAAIAGTWARAIGPGHWPGTAWPLLAAGGAAAADWVENTFHLIAIEPTITGESPIALAVAIGSVFAAIKWIGIIAGLTAITRAAWKRGGWRWLPIGALCAGGAGAIAGVVFSTAV